MLELLQTTPDQHDLVDYVPSEYRFGTNSFKYCTYDGQIYEALLPFEEMGDADINDPTKWRTTSTGVKTSDTVVINEDETAVTTDDGRFIVIDTSASTVSYILPDTDLIEDYRITITVRGDNQATVNTFIPTDTIDGTVEPIIINNKEIYEFVYDKSGSQWYVGMRETNPVMGNVSHFVGFFTRGTTFYADIIAMTGSESIDLTKYDALFKDGTPAFMIVDGPVTLTTADIVGIILIEE